MQLDPTQLHNGLIKCIDNSSGSASLTLGLGEPWVNADKD